MARPDLAPGDISVLIADRQALFRAGMRRLLEELPHRVRVTEAGSGAETVEVLRKRRFDLIMLEMLMPDFLPLPLLHAVQLWSNSTPLIVVSSATQPDDVRAALDAGASGFVSKDCAPDVMVQATMLVLSGGVYVPVGELGSRRPRAAPVPAAGTGPSMARLTSRHRTILQYLASGFSNKEIASALGIAEGTVKAHIAVVLRRLGARNRTHAIIIAGQHGLLSRPSGFRPHAIPLAAGAEDNPANGERR